MEVKMKTGFNFEQEFDDYTKVQKMNEHNSLLIQNLLKDLIAVYPGMARVIERIAQYKMDPEVVVKLIDTFHNLSFDFTDSPVRFRKLAIYLKKEKGKMMIDNIESTTSIAIDKEYEGQV